MWVCGVWVNRCMCVWSCVYVGGANLHVAVNPFSRGAHFMCKRRGRKRCIPVIESFRKATPYRDVYYRIS